MMIIWDLGRLRLLERDMEPTLLGWAYCLTLPYYDQHLTWLSQLKPNVKVGLNI